MTLITAKPVVYLVNLSLNDYVNKKNKWLPKIKQWVDERGDGFASSLIPLSCELEIKLSSISNQSEKDEYLKSLGVPTALPKIIVTGYKTLQLVYYFTAGPDEVRAWTLRVSADIPQCPFLKCFGLGVFFSFFLSCTRSEPRLPRLLE